MKKIKPIYGIMILIVILAVALDQLVKVWVTGNMELYASRGLIPRIVGLFHTQNTGVAFSFLNNVGWLLPVLSSLALLLILFVIIRREVTHPFGLVTLAMVFGGALGNLIDRVRLGYVVDMFEFLFIRFAVFNVADIFITVGGALFCVYLLLLHEKDRRARASGEKADA